MKILKIYLPTYLKNQDNLDDHKTSFSKLLKIDKSVNINKKNLQNLAIEIYKVKKTIFSIIIIKILKLGQIKYKCKKH